MQDAITALHCEAADAKKSDWPQIVALYRLMERVAPCDIVRLTRNAVNLAVAVSYGERGRRALELMAPRLNGYQPYFETEADLMHRTGHFERARVAYGLPLVLTTGRAEPNAFSFITG